MSKLSTVIESLEIEIHSNSTSAAEGVDKLTASLAKLKNAVKGGDSFRPLSEQLAKLDNILKQFSEESAEKMAKLTSGITALSATGDIKISASIANQISKIGAAMETVSSSGIDKLNAVAAAIGKMPGFSNMAVPDVGMLSVAEPMMDSSRAISSATDEMLGHSKVTQEATVLTKGWNKQLTSFTKFLKQLGTKESTSKIGKIGDSLRRVGSATSGATSKLGQFFNSLKRIAMYRIVRSALSALSNSMREGISNLYKYSEAFGGTFSQSLDTCATSFLYLKNSLASMVSPLLNALAPAIDFIIDKFVILINFVNMFLAALSGAATYTVAKKQLAQYAAGVSDAGAAATKAAKEIKDATLGIDELNVISPPTQVAASGGGGSSSPNYGEMFEEVTIDPNILNFVNWLGENLEDIKKTAAAIGVSLLAWTVAKGLISTIDKIKGLLSTLSGFSFEWVSLGAIMFLADLNEFMKYFDDFLKNGPTFHNVVGMLSEFAGMVGDVLIVLGNLKLGGALKIVQGIGEIILAVEDISTNGVNWDNASTAIRGLSNIAIGIGVFTGNIELAAWGVAIQGFTSVIGEIGKNWKEIREGDFSGVDKVTLIIGGLEILGGLVIALDVFSKLKGLTGVGKAAEAVSTVTTATQDVTTSTSTLSPKLKSLALNLGLGLVIIAEVAVAAILIAGAIWVLGKELEQVGIAWQPVIDNGGNIAIAMGIGIGILVGVGAVTYLLGTFGGPMAASLGMGMVMLALLGAAAALFIIEIWAIGKGLDEIGEAWAPVLANGDTIATGIAIGTALLIGIGVVTAALGVATVATGGALPAAIALGTAILLELSVAFIVFTKSLVAVANELSDNLSPTLITLNSKLPTLSTNMGNFVEFMSTFAGQVVKYTKANAVAGLAATIDTIIGWFTADPLKKLSDDVNKIYSQTQTLNEKLGFAVPELKKAVDLLRKYTGFLSELEKITSLSGNAALSSGMFINMKEVGQKLSTGFAEGIKSKASEFTGAATEIINGFKAKVDSYYTASKPSITTWAKKVHEWFTSNSNGAVNKEKFASYATEIINGFKNKIESAYATSQSSVITWANKVHEWFTNSSQGAVNKEKFATYAADIITGFKDEIGFSYGTSQTNMTKWAGNVLEWFTDPSYGSVNPEEFASYATGIIDGFKNRIDNYHSTAQPAMVTFASAVRDSFEKPNASSLASQFATIGADVIHGFINGVNSLWDSAMSKIKSFGESVIRKGKEGTQERSPSRAFEEIGMFVIQGFNIGLEQTMNSSFKIMDEWLEGINSFAPVVSVGLDTSALKYHDSGAFAKNISANVDARGNFALNDGFEDAMGNALEQYYQNHLAQMADDVRRQADKEEKTIVQVGNKVITNAVTTQRRADGYSFVKA